MGLHWFDVTLDTPMRSIGWVWVVLVLAVIGVGAGVRFLVRHWNDP